MLDNNLVIPKNEATEYKPFPEDIYSVQFLDVNAKEVETYDSKEARKKDPTLAQIMETIFDFQFVLLEGKDGETDLRGRNIFQNFVPSYLYISSKGKNKLFQIVESLQGSPLSQKQEAEGITGADLNALIGKHCRVVTINKTHGDKTYSNIDKFLVAKGNFEPLTVKEKEDAKVKPKVDEGAEQKAESDYEGVPELTESDVPFGGRA
jgi:hypothetical protein